MMFYIKRIAAVALLALSASAMPLAAQAQGRIADFINDDDLFQALREAARHDDTARAFDYASRLGDYPLQGYVEYYSLEPRLRTASEADIRGFLQRHDGTAIADRMRTDWLLELGRRREWETFDEQYALLQANDDLQVKCFALMSKAVKGQNVADDARALLTSPKDYGEPCHALIATLAQAGQFDRDDVWAQIRLAADQNYLPSARRLTALTGTDEKTIQRAIVKPLPVVAHGVHGGYESHQLFIVALGRAAHLDLEKATKALNNFGKRLNADERSLAWSQVAMQASYKLAPEALADWDKVGAVHLSDDAYQWRARIALRAGDWKKLKADIEAMPEALRASPAWVYWMGRALKVEGRTEEANMLFASIEDRVHFYGQLASEELGRPITISQTAKPVTPEELMPIAENPGLQRALKLFELNMRPEAVREWNWEVRKMTNERDLLAAAEFARQNELLDRMVSTSDRTKLEIDFNQRFPTPFHDFMYNTTNILGLDMAWVYGLIRQESRFVMNARSEVGASGLMQLMPGTAHLVARKIGMRDFKHHEVNDIQTNIRLGTNYLNMVLEDVDGSQALATAAYNAGPRRPLAWRATLDRPVEGAIFVETIPFSETRGYVKNVMSNATYYAALFEGKPQSLKARLGIVNPEN